MKPKTLTDDSVPRPVTDRSSRADLWDELCAARGEIDTQQQGIQEAMAALDTARAENKALRTKLASAYLRLGVIQAALAHSEVP
jgi:hypothetical protein